jgi:iron complex outermembrane receptor protein
MSTQIAWGRVADQPGNRKYRIRPIILLGALLASDWASAAIAGDGDPPDLTEVVVTATKHETKLFQTPISMTVLTGETLKEVGAIDFGDFTRLVPGLTETDTGPGQKRYALRGLQSAGEPEVALYYDEIPISGVPGNSLDTGASQPDFELVDVDRIEVVRGPQGTLYGNGSMGGAIRIISKRPDLDNYEGDAELDGAVTEGGDPSRRGNGMLNIPLIQGRLALRLVAYYRDEGGWIDDPYLSDIHVPQVAGNNLNWEHTWGGRASLTFKVNDNWDITGIGYYQSLKTGDSFETYPSFATPDDPYISKAFVRTPWTDRAQMFNLISTYHFAWADLVATGSSQRRNVDTNVDSTRYLISLANCTVFTWDQGCTGTDDLPADSASHEGVSSNSGEIRLASSGAGPLVWTVGAFIQDTDTFRIGQLAETDAAGYNVYDPTTGDALNRLFARTNHDTFNQYAYFGEGTYEFLPKWKATVGLRWFHSDRSDQQDLVQQFFPGEPVGLEPFQRFTESALFKKFQVSYQLAENTLLYTEAAQGFRAGGPNYPGGFTATAPPYGSDSIWDYEVGWKTALADRRVEWTGAIFRMNWTNVQQLLPTALFSAIVNAGNARSDGFETELDTKVTQDLSIDIGTSLANAHLIGPQPIEANPTLQLVEGDRLGGAPKWTANAAATYSKHVGTGLELRGRIDYTYQSSRSDVVDAASPSYFVIKGGGLTGLHAALERDDGWVVALHVENLLNRFVPLSGTTEDGNLIRTITAARPRTLVLSVEKKF